MGEGPGAPGGDGNGQPELNRHQTGFSLLFTEIAQSPRGTSSAFGEAD